VVLAIGAGVGVLAYLICWLAIPMEPAGAMA
jgi:phage shock protein PspC (stress-responsive transcriptional regulator)